MNPETPPRVAIRLLELLLPEKDRDCVIGDLLEESALRAHASSRASATWWYCLTDNELDFRPKPGMRTPRELVFHIYGQEQALAEGARDGSFTMEMANRSNPEDPSSALASSALATVADAVGYARACHDEAERIFRAMSEDDVVRPVNSPFGTYPAWQYLVFAYDEHWHHRGQLYTYLRLLGKEPPMLYDYQVSVG